MDLFTIITITKVTTFSFLFNIFIELFIVNYGHEKVIFVSYFFYTMLASVFRLLVPFGNKLTKKPGKIRTMVIGAGIEGMLVVKYLQLSSGTDLKPVVFIDDDPLKQNTILLGIEVIGGKEVIQDTVNKLKINRIIIAMPTLSKNQLDLIINECNKTRLKPKIIPKIEDIIVGEKSLHNSNEIQVKDILIREPVSLNTESISVTITEKTILVTGAGGSIGSEICCQICKYNPKKIILVGHGENSIYSINTKLREQLTKGIEIIPIIASIQDRERIEYIFKKYKPDIVYHAAAHKHVPLMEDNPKEAVNNNIIGTKNVAEASEKYCVGTFVLISSDKAVNPTSVMGATKRLAEMIIQNISIVSKTKFVTVRFGNVLGSRGSVIPLFNRQIQEGGPITITHPEMHRYFMTIPEASGLVIQAGIIAKGGEILVLDMGEPVKIVDLAKNLIKLSGHKISDIGIKFTGLRPGEKLYEELVNKDEVFKKFIFPKIFVVKTPIYNKNTIDKFLKNFNRMNDNEIKSNLLAITNYTNLKKKIKQEDLI